MRRTFFAGCTATLFLVMLVQGGFAASGLINYQGRLTDKKGRPVTATVSVTFTFHDAEAGGNLLGGFSDTDQVTPDANGLYATLIGDDPDNLVPDSIFKSERVWLNVNINGENLLPRKRLTSSGLAMTASSVMGGEVGRARFAAGTRVQAGDVVLLQEDGKIAPARYPGWNTAVKCFPEIAYWDIADSACPMGPNKVLAANPNVARVAAVDGDRITLGNLVQLGNGFNYMVNTGGRTHVPGLASLGENRALIAYPEMRETQSPGDEWNVLVAAVATANGTSLTLSTPFAAEDFQANSISCASLGASQVLVAAYTGATKCIVATVTGEGSSASIEFGNPATLIGSVSYAELCPLSSSPGKALMVYTSSATPNAETAVVATVSGTGRDATISFGPPSSFGDRPLVGVSLVSLQENRALISDWNPTTYDLRATALSVSGTTISAATPVTYGQLNSLYDNNAPRLALMSSGKVCFAWGIVYSPCGGVAVMATIEGSTPVFGKPLRFANLGHLPVPQGLENDRVLILDGTEARIISAEDQGNYLTGLSTCIGVAESDALAGQSCLVTIPGGITEQFSGLTPGARYWATETSLVKDPPGSGSCMFLGVALTPNKLQVWR